MYAVNGVSPSAPQPARPAGREEDRQMRSESMEAHVVHPKINQRIYPHMYSRQRRSPLEWPHETISNRDPPRYSRNPDPYSQSFLGG